MTHDNDDQTNRERWEDLRHDEEAFLLHQEEKRLQVARRTTALSLVSNSILGLTAALEILLGLRFALRLFGANPENQFAQFINSLSAPFVAPFSTLFISPTTQGGANIFDVNIVIAIVAYALLSYLVISLINFLFYQKV